MERLKWRKWRWSWTAIALVGLMVVPALGQDEIPVDEFVDRVDVPRVLVDLLVQSRSGEPITDLEKSEIRVFEDGEEVEILGFSRPGGSAQSDAEEDASAAAEAPHTYVLYFDELHLRPPNRKRMVKQLRDSADRLVEEGSQVTVVSYDGNVNVLLDATTDLDALKETLANELKASHTPMLSNMASPEYAVQLIQSRMREESANRQGDGTPDKGGGGPPSWASSGDPCVDVGGLARTSADQADAVAQGSINGMRMVIGSMARFAGRKSLIHVSDGIPLVPGLEVLTFAIEMCDGTAAHQGIPNAVDTQEWGLGRHARWDPVAARLQVNERDTTKLWADLSAYANTRQVSVYPFQATGLAGKKGGKVTGARVTPTFELQAAGNPRDTLFMIADATGGEAFFNTNRFDNSLEEVADQAGAFYELSFEPRNPGSGRRHKIRVEVDRKGVTSRYRQSFVALTAGDRLADLVMSAVLHGGGANPLGIRVVPKKVVAATGGISNLTVEVLVPLDRLAMLRSGEDRRGSFTVAVGGKESNGRFLPIGQKQIDVRASEADRESEAFRYEVEVPFRRKELTLAVAVRDEVGGDLSTLTEVVAAAGG